MLSRVHVIENAVAKHREILTTISTENLEPSTINTAMDHVLCRVGTSCWSEWISADRYH